MKYRIGAFEKMTGIQRATLRYYDNAGLLFPQRDDENNYRAYSEKDILRLVQLKQFNSFGVSLSSLPAVGKDTSCGELLAHLEARHTEIERSIDEMYQLLARVKLHEASYRAICEKDDSIIETKMVGTYRLFYSVPEVFDHPNTPDILKRWLTYAPYVYSVVRLRQEELSKSEEEMCQADLGVGLMKNYFDQMGETFAEPMQYSPVTRCLRGMIETENPREIPASALRPFIDYMDQAGLIPLSDFYGWVVYVPGGEKKPLYRISMRIAIG